MTPAGGGGAGRRTRPGAGNNTRGHAPDWPRGGMPGAGLTEDTPPGGASRCRETRGRGSVRGAGVTLRAPGPVVRLPPPAPSPAAGFPSAAKGRAGERGFRGCPLQLRAALGGRGPEVTDPQHPGTSSGRSLSLLPQAPSPRPREMHKLHFRSCLGRGGKGSSLHHAERRAGPWTLEKAGSGSSGRWGPLGTLPGQRRAWSPGSSNSVARRAGSGKGCRCYKV